MQIPDCAVALENTPFVMLKTDAILPAKARELGTIAIETELANLPEVKALNRNSVVLDVGAFIGDTAVIFEDRGACVYAFEPFPDAFACLCWNSKNRSILCYNWAVGNGEHVELNFERLDDNDGNRSVIIMPGGKPTRRLDSERWPRVDLLKIDVEGFELEVLAGAKETIERFRPVIIIEANDVMLNPRGLSKQDIKRAVEAMGYFTRVGVGSEEADHCDYVCLPV